MKRTFVVGLLGGLAGSVLLVMVISAAGAVGARGVSVGRNDAQPYSISRATPLTNTFTYQGQLKSNGSPISGTCDFQFGLWDGTSGGLQIGVTQTVSSLNVGNGLFTAVLNTGDEFGVNAFNGQARWLRIAVACPSGSGYTALDSLQELTAAPYALYSPMAGYANSAGSATTANSVSVPALRKYYLTTTPVSATAMISACAIGYHAASLWEILNVSNLLYDTSLGKQTADSGYGPPSDIPGYGWIRTGATSYGVLAVPGQDNCDAWTTNSSSVTGTVTGLASDWRVTAANVFVQPWFPFAVKCNISYPAWCVQDLP